MQVRCVAPSRLRPAAGRTSIAGGRSLGDVVDVAERYVDIGRREVADRDLRLAEKHIRPFAPQRS